VKQAKLNNDNTCIF